MVQKSKKFFNIENKKLPYIWYFIYNNFNNWGKIELTKPLKYFFWVKKLIQFHNIFICLLFDHFLNSLFFSLKLIIYHIALAKIVFPIPYYPLIQIILDNFDYHIF